LKLDRFVDVQGSGKVLLVQTVVLGAKTLSVEHTNIDEELAPGMLAVAGQQRSRVWLGAGLGGAGGNNSAGGAAVSESRSSGKSSVRATAYIQYTFLAHSFSVGGWMPGTYDAETNAVWWGTGNPSPLYDWAGGDWEKSGPRPGANLYTTSVIALGFLLAAVALAGVLALLVGGIHLSTLEIVIQPKLPIERLLFLISYVIDRVGWREGFEFVERDSLLEAVIPGFVSQVRRAIS
jgi:hypothetical protein